MGVFVIGSTGLISAAGLIFSWYNDSGFWIVKEIGGLTQAKTFKI